MSKELVQRLAADIGGTVEESGRLPDGSGFALLAMPLLPTHWCYGDPACERDGFEPPPMPLRLGMRGYIFINGLALPDGGKVTRERFAKWIRAAGRYAYRKATMNGTKPDLDPDALLQNLVVGLLGYWTETGLSEDEWANPARDECGNAVPPQEER